MSKTKKEWRILLHSMTFKRDFGALFVLSNLLEKFGCKCFISNNADACSKHMSLWDPHAVFYVTMGRTERFKKRYPKAKLFLCSGEGGESRRKVNERDIITNQFLSDSIDRVYLWGNAAWGYVKEKVDEVGESSPFYKNDELFQEKFTMAGNPRIDLIRYKSPKSENNKKVKVGLIGAFSFINNNSYQLLSVLANRVHIPNIKEDIAFQFRVLKKYWEIIDTLDSEKYEFNLRPYPLENITEYYETEFYKQKKLIIDDCLDFSTWLSIQDVIIAPISSTVCQIFLSKKPFICLDKLCERPEIAYTSGQIPEALRKIAQVNSPDTEEELYNLMKNKTALEIRDSTLEEKLHKHYNSSVNHSILLQIAVDIIKKLEDELKIPKGFSIPFPLMTSFNDLRLKYIQYRNPRICETNYSYFIYKDICKKAESEFMGIYENILADPKNQDLLKKLESNNE